ncbi:transcriptional regulator [Jatrophihabitans endophyticus]|uniref:Transcriptional regulator n=1 Tax=Jatrophihabitans endophyticus TaxID=1206085 RepID=A0A1M5HF76_9ACTN|nr:sugar-binding domain-containing protein [Jatrophihabitans endophyticus]SHG14603.1 transcriptional regulator [Jatrophihabitans endophyticus]
MSPTPGQHVLLARVARLFYLDELSKSDIADRLGISRFRVARLLETARREGIVSIRIESPAGVDTELSVQLQERFGLAHAVVIEHGGEDMPELRRRLGQVAAGVLSEIVTADDVLGLAWARSLQGVGAAVRSIAACPVVQLTGALSGPDGSDVLELVRSVAQAGGGTPHVYYAPLVAPDAASARVVLRQPDVARALELADRVTVAAVGIGAWEPGLSTIYDMVEPEAREQASALGTIGEISGALVGRDGHSISGALSKRIIGVTGDQLRRAGTVISVAYGRGKADAVRAALRGGLVNGLVTHTELARALLVADQRATEPAAADAG